MIGMYFAIFGVVCAVGIFAEVRSQLSRLSQGAPVDYLETALRIIKGSGSVGIGAASIALTIAIAWEGIMVLAQFVKRRQLAEGIRIGREQGLEQGIEQGREQGIEQGREQGIEQGREQGEARGIATGEARMRDRFIRWLARKEEAERLGLAFTEPMPGADGGVNGHTPQG